MDFLKGILGDSYTDFETKIKAYNDNPDNKERPIKLANLGEGNYVSKSKYDALEAAKTSLEEQLNTAVNSLAKFKDVDVDQLKGELDTLRITLDRQKTDYETRIADMEFNSELSDAIKAAGGRSVKAICAELDIDTLKASKNRKDDIATAIEAHKEASAYLYGADEPINNPVAPTGGGGGADANTSALRAAMGLPAESK